jgi:putative protein kinase ArgK-like GTPase of G3E family
VISVAELWRVLLDAAGPRTGRPVVVGIGGRSSSGETTLAARLAASRLPDPPFEPAFGDFRPFL